MKPKTKAFADTLLANPKMSQTEAYLRTHETTNRSTARVEASKLLATPNIQTYMEQQAHKAALRVAELVSSSKEDIALRASNSILDRALGKPKQQIEVASKTVHIDIDLTGTQNNQSD